MFHLGHHFSLRCLINDLFFFALFYRYSIKLLPYLPLSIRVLVSAYKLFHPTFLLTFCKLASNFVLAENIWLTLLVTLTHQTFFTCSNDFFKCCFF